MNSRNNVYIYCSHSDIDPWTPGQALPAAPFRASGPGSDSQGICLHLRPVSAAQLQAREAAATAVAPVAPLPRLPWSFLEPGGFKTFNKTIWLAVEPPL
jgi:hypothetical protein